MTVDSITRRPAKIIFAPGSAKCMSPNIAKEAVIPPAVAVNSIAALSVPLVFTILISSFAAVALAATLI